MPVVEAEQLARLHADQPYAKTAEDLERLDIVADYAELEYIRARRTHLPSFDGTPVPDDKLKSLRDDWIRKRDAAHFARLDLEGR